MEQVPVFRAAKRRKFTRLQQELSPDSAQRLTPPDTHEGHERADDSNDEDLDGDNAGITNLIRARKHARKLVTGVQFSTAKVVRAADEDASRAVVKLDENVEKSIDITNRFVGSTGQVVNVDRHMVAFIDSEIAKRRHAPASSFGELQRHRIEEIERDMKVPNGAASMDPKTSTANPAAARQLAEVDLGSSAHDTNLARTQAALQRVKAGQAPSEDEVKPPKPRKPRLGRDGKPMKPRPRKRRNSEDVARDALVEQVLHEHRIDLYETGTPEPTKSAGPVGGAAEEADADERFAERFRQDFMDAMAERRTKTKSSTQAKGAVTTESRGPKLGGSRSARAKMAEMQKQQQQQGATSSKK